MGQGQEGVLPHGGSAIKLVRQGVGQQPLAHQQPIIRALAADPLKAVWLPLAMIGRAPHDGAEGAVEAAEPWAQGQGEISGHQAEEIGPRLQRDRERGAAHAGQCSTESWAQEARIDWASIT